MTVGNEKPPSVERRRSTLVTATSSSLIQRISWTAPGVRTSPPFRFTR
jgi:hypothetical protein